MNKKEAIISDTHIKTYNLRRYLTGDSLFSFSQFIDYCIDPVNNISRIHLLGDIFDKNILTSDIVNGFVSNINRVPDYIIIDAIEGNHDRSNPPWFKSLTNRINHVHLDENYRVAGRKAIGIDNLKGVELLQTLSNIPPDTEILCVHQLFKEAIGIGYDLLSADVPEFVKLVIAGDYHHPVEWMHNKTKFVYNGSTVMQKINEPLNKSFMVIDKDLNIERVPLKIRPFNIVKLDTVKKFNTWVTNFPKLKQSFDKQTIDYPDEVKMPFLFVEFSEEIPDGYTKLKSVVGDSCFLHASILQNKTLDNLPANSTNTNLQECLLLLVDPATEPELAKFTNELLSNTNYKETITRWQDQYLNPKT